MPGAVQRDVPQYRTAPHHQATSAVLRQSTAAAASVPASLQPRSAWTAAYRTSKHQTEQAACTSGQPRTRSGLRRTARMLPLRQRWRAWWGPGKWKRVEEWLEVGGKTPPSWRQVGRSPWMQTQSAFPHSRLRTRTHLQMKTAISRIINALTILVAFRLSCHMGSGHCLATKCFNCHSCVSWQHTSQQPIELRGVFSKAYQHLTGRGC